MRWTQVRWIVGIIFAGLLAVSCTQTKISDINADPGSFKNKEITVAGEVVQSMGASLGSFSKGVYEISDGTGSLWVYSESRGVPSKGAHVGVKGRVAQSVTVMGHNYATVLQESDRRIEK